ncbi:30S ribosomal protein S13 [candidate division WWE3 bacterium]|nr:30S ribosomal protein S13 [candidate division WWE3 bacterium]
MARIAGVDIPTEKRIEIALTYINGIGLTISQKILKTAGIDLNTRVKELNEAQLASIRNTLDGMHLQVEGELKRSVNQNIRRLIDIKSYRGSRHKAGLPTRGQRTRSNARTRKGKRKTVGGLKRKIAK